MSENYQDIIWLWGFFLPFAGRSFYDLSCLMQVTWTWGINWSWAIRFPSYPICGIHEVRGSEWLSWFLQSFLDLVETSEDHQNTFGLGGFMLPYAGWKFCDLLCLVHVTWTWEWNWTLGQSFLITSPISRLRNSQSGEGVNGYRDYVHAKLASWIWSKSSEDHQDTFWFGGFLLPYAGWDFCDL